MVQKTEKWALILSVKFLVERKHKEMLANKKNKHKIHTKSLSNNNKHNKSTWKARIISRSHLRTPH